jgi:hypothetical protein
MSGADAGLGEQMVVVAVRLLLWRARMRYNHRAAVQAHVLAEQRKKKLEQETVREHLRAAERAGHAQRDIVARGPHPDEPVRRRFLRLSAHGGQIQRSELG